MSSGIHFFVAINVLVHRSTNADEFVTLQTKSSHSNATLTSSSSSSETGSAHINNSRLSMQSEIEAMPGKPQVKIINVNKRQHEVISFPNAQLLLQTLKASGDLVHIMTTWGVEETIAIVKAFGWTNFIVDVRTLSKSCSSEYYTLESVKCNLEWLANAMFIVRNKKEWHEKLHEWIIEVNHAVTHNKKHMAEVSDYKNNKHHHIHERRTWENEAREYVNNNNVDGNNNSKRAKAKTPQDIEKYSNSGSRSSNYYTNHKNVLNDDKISRERKHKQNFISMNEKFFSAIPAVTDNDKYTKHKAHNKEYELANIRNNDHTNTYRYVRNLLSSMELLYVLCRCLTLAEWRVRFPGTPIVNCIALSKCTLFSFCRFYLLPQQEWEEEEEYYAQNISLLLLQINEYGGVIVHDEMQATHVICRQGNWGTYDQLEFAVNTNRDANVKNENEEERVQETNTKEEGSMSSQTSSWSSSSSSSSFSTLSSSSSSSSLEEILSSEESSLSSEEQERSSYMTLYKNQYKNKSRQAEQAKKRNSKSSKNKNEWNNHNKQKQSLQENTISDTDSISSVPSSSSSASFKEMMRNDGLMSSRNVDESVLRERQERRSIALRRSEVAQNINISNNFDALENVNTPSARAPFTPRNQFRSNATSKAESASNNLTKSRKNKVISTEESTKSNNNKFDHDDDSKNTSSKRSMVTDNSKGKSASIKQERSSISESETAKLAKQITGKASKEANKSTILLRNTEAVVITAQWILNCCRAWRILPVNRSWSASFTERSSALNSSSATLPSSLSKPTQSKFRLDSQEKEKQQQQQQQQHEQREQGEMEKVDEFLRTCGALLCAMLPPEDARPLPFVHFLYIAQLYLYNYTFLLADTFAGTVDKVQMYFGDVVKLRQSKSSQMRMPNLMNAINKSILSTSEVNKSLCKSSANDKTSVYAEGVETLMLFRNERKRDHSAVASHLQLLSAQFEYSIDHVRREWRLRNSASTGTQTSAPRFASMSVNTEAPFQYTKSEGFNSSQDDEHSSNAVVVVKLENEHQSQERYDHHIYGFGQDSKGVFDFIRNAHALPLHGNGCSSVADLNTAEQKYTYNKQGKIKLEELEEEEEQEEEQCKQKEREETYQDKQSGHSERWLTLSTETNATKSNQENSEKQLDRIFKHDTEINIQSDMNTIIVENKLECKEDDEDTRWTKEEEEGEYEVEARNMEAEEKINDNDSEVKEWRLHLKNVEGKLLKSKQFTQQTTEAVAIDMEAGDHRQKEESTLAQEVCTSPHTEDTTSSGNLNSENNTLYSTSARREQHTLQNNIAHENIMNDNMNRKSHLANIHQSINEFSSKESALAISTCDDICESVFDMNEKTHVLQLSNTTTTTTTTIQHEELEQTSKYATMEVADSIFPLPPLPISLDSALPLHSANRIAEVNSYYHETEKRLHDEQRETNQKSLINNNDANNKSMSHLTSSELSTSELSILPLPEHGTSSILPLAPTTTSLFPLPPTIMTTIDELHALQKKQQQQQQQEEQEQQNHYHKDGKEEGQELEEEQQHHFSSHVEDDNDSTHEKTKMEKAQSSSLSSLMMEELPENVSESSENSETQNFTKCFIPTYKLSVEQQVAFVNYLRQLPLFANDDHASVEMEAMGVQCSFATHRDASDFLRVRYLEHDNVHLDIFPLHETLPTANREHHFLPFTEQTAEIAHLYPIDSLITHQEQESSLQHYLHSESILPNNVFDAIQTTSFSPFTTHEYDASLFPSADQNLQTFSGQESIVDHKNNKGINEDKETTSVVTKRREEVQFPLLRVYKSVELEREEERESEPELSKKHTELEVNKSVEKYHSGSLKNTSKFNKHSENKEHNQNMNDAPEQLSYQNRRHEQHRHRRHRDSRGNSHNNDKIIRSREEHTASDKISKKIIDEESIRGKDSSNQILTSKAHTYQQEPNLESEPVSVDKLTEYHRRHHRSHQHRHHYPSEDNRAHREHKRYRNESADSKESQLTSTRYKTDLMQRTNTESDKETMEKKSEDNVPINKDNNIPVINHHGSVNNRNRRHQREKSEEEQSQHIQIEIQHQQRGKRDHNSTNLEKRQSHEEEENGT